MAKYIDADDLMYKLDNAYDDEMSEFRNEYAHGIGIAQQILEEMPAADVGPVRHGEWKTEGNFIRCTVCRYPILFEKHRYCPGCGAKMDGGIEDDYS